MSLAPAAARSLGHHVPDNATVIARYTNTWPGDGGRPDPRETTLGFATLAEAREYQALLTQEWDERPRMTILYEDYGWLDGEDDDPTTGAKA